MRKKIINLINHTTLTQHFISAPSPQWLVLIVDVCIVVICSLFTLILNSDPTAHLDGWHYSLPAKLVLITAVYLVTMFAIAPYKSIVRLSTFEDTYRVGVTVLFASLLLSFLEGVVNWTGTFRFIGIWNIFVIGIMAFSMMVCVRLMVKYVYRAVTDDHNRQRVVILGSSINAYAMASALASEIDGRFEPVLMLSINAGHSDKSANGIPIKAYDPDNVAEIFRKANADTLLFLASEIEFMRSGAADVFLENGIKLLMINQVEEFGINDDLSPNISPHVQDIKIEDLLGREPIVTVNKCLADNLRDRTILVTGAAGSIGSEIVRQLAGYAPGNLVLLDQAETPMHNLQLEMEKTFPNVRTTLCIADIVNKDRMREIFSKYRPQIVYHAAAYKHVPMMENNPAEAVHNNIFGTKIAADLALEHGVDAFVMISTDKAVNPTNIMGASKRIAEIYVQSLANNLRAGGACHTRFITTRFGNVLGSNGSVIPLFRQQIAEGGPVTVTHRDIIRYFMTIPEACSLVLEAGCMGEGGEIFIFDMGKPVRIYDLATRMISLAGLRPNIDIKIVETGLRPGEKLYEELLNDHELTIPTHNKKIMIAKVRIYDYSDVRQRLADLKDILKSRNVHDIVAQMKRLVPEFKSQNSKFSTIDGEISENEVIHEIDINNKP